MRKPSAPLAFVLSVLLIESVLCPGTVERNPSGTASDRANPGPRVSFRVSGVEPGTERRG
jgi:hypothetical protein